MQNPNATIPRSPPATDQVEGVDVSKLPWQAEVGEMLAQAAQLCADNGIDLDTFMKGAWQAYIEARPGLRDYLEEMQLRTHLDEMRKLGRVGEA